MNEEIQKNKESFQKLSERYNITNESLNEFLGESLFEAPASVQIDMYRCYPGGLVEHLINTIAFGLNINKALPEEFQVNKEKVARVCGLYEIGKTFLFQENDIKWEVEKRGKIYKYNNDLVSMHVGERSAYYCLINGKILPEDEYQAILNYEKNDDDKMSFYHTENLGDILKQANWWAVKTAKQNEQS